MNPSMLYNIEFIVIAFFKFYLHGKYLILNYNIAWKNILGQEKLESPDKQREVMNKLTSIQIKKDHDLMNKDNYRVIGNICGVLTIVNVVIFIYMKFM